MKMELFLWEHKRLWRRKTTQISVFLCMVYLVVFGCILSYQWFTFGSSAGYDSFSNRFDGYAHIRAMQRHARKFGGELTDESLQEMVRDYQRASAAGDDQALDNTDWQGINSWLVTLYPELKDLTDPRLMISYVDPGKLTDLYGRRQKRLEEFLEVANQTGREREYLLAMNGKVEIPFSCKWREGWGMILTSVVSDMGTFMALFLAISLSPVFAGEWHNRTGPLLLATKRGWRETALAKIGSSFAFAGEMFLMLTVGSVLFQVIFLGTEGWDMPIQIIKMIAVAPLNMLQAEIYGYAFALLGGIGFAGVVMLLSSLVKSGFSALILSLAAVYVPVIVSEFLPFQVQKAMDLLPLVGSSADVFRTNTFCIFGRYIWSPYLLISVPVLIGLVCVPFAARRWARRMRT